MPSHANSKRQWRKACVNAVSEEAAQQIVVEFLRKKKNTEKIDVVSIERKDAVWIIHGTCPIDLQGHPWTERFEVVIDQKGRIKSTDFSLL
jgi:hypothetical protein